MIGCFYIPTIGIACELSRVPYYRDQPLALGSPGNTICAVSSPAVKCGVSTGMTITAARSLCRALVVLPYNKSIYEEAAEAVWDAIATESSVVEPVSPELCFVSFGRSIPAESIENLASLLASKIGVPITVGLGSSKLVAEQAAKKTGRKPVVEVEMGMEAVFLASVPLSEVKAIAQPVQARLERLGVRTLGDILRLPQQSLGYQFREVSGLLRKLAVGDDYDPVKSMWPPPKITCEHRFDEDTVSTAQLHFSVQRCATAIAHDLCDDYTYCRKVTLAVTFDDNSTQQMSERLRVATRDQGELLTAGLRLLRRLPVDRPVSAVNFAAEGLGSGAGAQLSLLPSEDEQQIESSRRIEDVLAFLRHKFGISAIVLASLLAITRQVDLLTYPLGCKKREDVTVATNQKMEPVRFYRRQKHSVKSKRYDVLQLQDHWQESAWAWDKLLDTDCYRVITDPDGFHQLEKLGLEWKLTSTAD